MPSASCWACKERRVSCDRKTPACSRCDKSNAKCQYGLRLSWPKPNDSKRTLSSAPPNTSGTRRRSRHVRLVNAGFWDIHLHHYLSSTSGIQEAFSADMKALVLPSLPKSLSWRPFELDRGDIDLLGYFKSIAFNSLATFDRDRSELRNLLLRLALSNASPVSRAVLQSALALSSLQRYGFQGEASRHKISALQILKASSANGIYGAEAFQHIAAGMILAHFEIQDIYDTPFQWIWYVCGAKHIMMESNFTDRIRDSELSTILDWVDYHVSSGQLSLRHWHKMPMQDAYNQTDIALSTLTLLPRVCQAKPITDISSCSHEIIRLLYSLFKNMLKPIDPSYHTPEYSLWIKDLEEKIHNVQPSLGTRNTPESAAAMERYAVNVELYKLAGLTYLERVSRNFSGKSQKINSYIMRAYEIFSGMEICDNPLPLFIFGCEARTDDHRIVILDLIENTLNASLSKGLDSVRRMIQAIWVQDDLDIDNELDYVTKLDTVITSNNIMPTFA